MVDLATITAQGKTASVNQTYAGNFQNLLNRLTSDGYKIKSLGGYNYRNIAGTNRLSKHALGNAIDINPGDNPVTYFSKSGMITDIPNASEHAKASGLLWGGDWKGDKRDPMHFEVIRGTVPMDASGAVDPQMVDAGASVTEEFSGYVTVNPDGTFGTKADEVGAGVVKDTKATGQGSAASVPEAIVTAGNQQATSAVEAAKATAAATLAATQSENTTNVGLFSGLMDWATNRLLQIMVFVLAAIFVLVGLYMFSKNDAMPALPSAA
jgi:hypothetical protein